MIILLTKVNSLKQFPNQPKPARWERRTDRYGRTYYADHNTHTTTWKKPTAESVRNFQQWKQNEASNLKERSQQHQRRFLLEGGDDDDPEDDGLGPLPEGWGECYVIPWSVALPVVEQDA